MFLKAKIYKQAGKFELSAEILNRIVVEFGNGLLGAKTYYELGLLYEDHLTDEVKAKEIYNNFLIKYPGSIYTSEVRKRFRKLRGDNKVVDENTEPIEF